MNARQSTWQAIADMEPDLMDVERWGSVLKALGASEGAPPDSLYAIGTALAHMGVRLRVQFEAALAVARENGR